MSTTVVAKLVVVGPDDRLLLLRRTKSDIRRPLQWDIPGGHTDGQEFGNEAAAREAQEESGLNIDPRSLQLVYSDCAYVVEKKLNVVWLFFVGRTNETDVILSAEHDEYRWVTLDGALELVEYDRQKKMFEYLQEHHLLHAAA